MCNIFAFYFTEENSKKMNLRANSGNFPMGWKFVTLLVTFLIVAFCIGSPSSGGGVEARRKYTFLNKWFKVACIAENLKV